MCGICGWVGDRAVPKDCRKPRIEAMVASIKHRGPDNDGYWFGDGVALGHTRLSILDLSGDGNQPMHAKGAPVSIVFNGEIYNFRALREALEKRGVVFESQCDTEVILYGYLEWGKDLFNRLNGIFALAVWDGRNGALILARDRLGVKPLYYSLGHGALIFGSEIKAILASGAIEKDLDLGSLQNVLWFGGAPFGNKTMFESVKKVLPGHHVTWRNNSIKETAYWAVDHLEFQEYSHDQAIARLRELLETSIKRQLVSDVPVGAFLSGGIDSSAIVAFGTKHYSGKLKTFSAGFDYEGGVNELRQARKVASAFGTEHHELHIKGGDIGDLLTTLVKHHDEPFGDAANIPLYLMCSQLKGSLKVILQGDGGDEMFGGYRRYSLLSRSRAWELAAHFRGVTDRFGKRGRRLRRILEAFATHDRGERMALLLTQETSLASPERVIAPGLRNSMASLDPFGRYKEFGDRFSSLDSVQAMLWTDAHILLPDVFLEKVDKPSMANGIEARVPFLDNELVEFALGLPSAQKVRGKEKKYLLRKALRGVVPDFVLDSPKTGFGVPYGHWIRTSLRKFFRDTVFQEANSELLDLIEVEKLAEQNELSGGIYDFLLWKVLNIALWNQVYRA